MAKSRCQVEGCSRPVYARRRCVAHYARLRRAELGGATDLDAPVGYRASSRKVALERPRVSPEAAETIELEARGATRYERTCWALEDWAASRRRRRARASR